MGEPYWASEDGDVVLHLGDCLDVLPSLPDRSVDAIVTDPPYALGFMGKTWDSPGAFVERPADREHRWDHVGGNHNPVDSADAARTRQVEGRRFQAWCQQWAAECLRVLKPGGWLLAFGGTRTSHRLICGIEDAGFEVRDAVADLTGIDGPGLLWLYGSGFPKSRESLKPSWEPIAVARKPLAGTVAANVLQHGTGALDIDGCRLAGGKDVPASPRRAPQGPAYGDLGNDPGTGSGFDPNVGRWPPNVALGPAAAAELDRQSGVLTSGANPARRGSDKFRDAYGEFAGQEDCTVHRGADSGGASRFFPVFRYEAKAAASERPRLKDGTAHPTVKPLDLMAWLVRLVTPPGGLVLDPFAGSGTTAEACMVEGFRCLLVEKDPSSSELIKTRLRKPIQPGMFRPEDSAPAAPVRPVAASRPKPAPEVHPSLFDELEAS